jgi:hypothetical protein
MCCKQNPPQSVIDDPLSEMHEIASQESTLMRFYFLYRQGDSDPIFAWWVAKAPRRGLLGIQVSPPTNIRGGDF